MTSIFLSCYNLPVIKQVAQVLGMIMNLLFKFFDMFGIQNIGLCILIFTILIKMILLPMTIKQQKFTKLSSIMNPEIQAVQKKYKNKKDQDSMMKMNQEMQAIYEKYGTSPTGGCLTLFIQMPILLALYGVISQIPVFIPEVGSYFDDSSAYISESVEYMYDLDKLDELKYKLDNGKDKEDNNLDEVLKAYYADKDGSADKEKIAENIEGAFKAMASSPNKIYEDIFNAYDETKTIASSFSGMSEEDWTKLLGTNEENAKEISEDDKKLIEKYRNADWTAINNSLDENKKKAEDIKVEVDNAYDFITINLSQSPSSAGGIISIIIPLLAAASQLLSVKLSNKFNATSQQTDMSENPMGSSMKMMTYTMPVMSAIFCYTLPAGLGVYWIMSALVQGVQTVVIGKYFVKVDADDIIKSNIEKQNKKRAKKGLPPKKITTAATTNVKNIKNENNKVDISKDTNGNNNITQASSNTESSKKGIAAKANLVKKYNDKK